MVWQWAGTNAAQLTVLVTLLGVLAALWYAVLTWRLWRETRAQTRLTRDMFQAEQRAYVSVWFDVAAQLDDRDLRTGVAYRIFLKNPGRSPASIQFGLVEIEHDGVMLGRLDVGTASFTLFPGDQQMIRNPLTINENNPLCSPAHLNACQNATLVKARVDYTETLEQEMPEQAVPGQRATIRSTAVTFNVTRLGTFVSHQVAT